MAKLAAVVVGVVAIVLGILFEKMNVNFLVGWAFSVAASANLPSLVMLLFWKRTTNQGITAAIIVGMISSLAWILLSGDTYKDVYGLPAADAIVPFSQPGIVTIPLGLPGADRRLARHLPPRPRSGSRAARRKSDSNSAADVHWGRGPRGNGRGNGRGKWGQVQFMDPPGAVCAVLSIPDTVARKTRCRQ